MPFAEIVPVFFMTPPIKSRAALAAMITWPLPALINNLFEIKAFKTDASTETETNWLPANVKLTF